MKKKKRGIWIIAVAVVMCITAGTVIGCNIGNKGLPKDHSYREGLYLRSENGSDMILIEGYNSDSSAAPCVMTAENDSVSFDDLTDGDRIRIQVYLIAESYPMQTTVYSLEKLADGERSDIDADLLAQLAEMGWINIKDTDTLPDDFDPAEFAAFIPNENAKVLFWDNIFVSPVYLYFCTVDNEFAVYYTDDFGKTINRLNVGVPNDIEYDTAIPILMTDGAGSGECQFVIKLKNQENMFYVSFNNYEWGAEKTYLEFNYAGVVSDEAMAEFQKQYPDAFGIQITDVLDDHRYHEGLYLSSDHGTDMILIENYNPDGSAVPCVMTAENDSVSFDDLTDGDRIRIEVYLIAESYPLQTTVYSIEKLADGERSDIDEAALAQYVGNVPKWPENGWIDGAPEVYIITSDELGKYRDPQQPDDWYTLRISDVSDAELRIVTDSEGMPYVIGIGAENQNITFDQPVELQGSSSIHIFKASGVVVFDRLYYHSGDTWALYGGGTYRMRNGYNSDGVLQDYFGTSFYKSDNGSLRHYKIANKYDGNLEQFGDWCVISCITDRGDIYSQSGDVYIQSNNLVFSYETAVTIADKFDLDALFERVEGKLAGEYAGCKSIDEVIAVNKEKYGLVMTEYTDGNWSRMNFDGEIQDQCRKFFYNFVSGKSDIPEYNALGITDWKITRKDSLFKMFPAFIFEFTVAGDSLDALPPGHYTKYIHDIRWTAIYDDLETLTAQRQNTDNKYARMVYGYLSSSYIWDCCDYGEWGDHVPLNFIINYYADFMNGYYMPYDTFLDYAKKLFGIESVDETNFGGFISVIDGVKAIEPGALGGGFFANVPEVSQTGDNYEVIVQLYADVNGILPSHRLKYTLGKNGEFLKFEVLKRSPYEPDGLKQYYTLNAE